MVLVFTRFIFNNLVIQSFNSKLFNQEIIQKGYNLTIKICGGDEPEGMKNGHI